MSMLTMECKTTLSPAHICERYHYEMALKDRITKARTEAGLNKSELAKECDVDPPAINKLESGDTKKISGELLLKISAVCGVDPFDLGGVSLPSYIEGRFRRVDEDPAKSLVTGWKTLANTEKLHFLKQAIEDLAPAHIVPVVSNEEKPKT